MKDEIYDKLFELSFKTKDRFVTPLILDYYRFESLGLDDEKILRLIENKYNPLKS